MAGTLEFSFRGLFMLLPDSMGPSVGVHSQRTCQVLLIKAEAFITCDK